MKTININGKEYTKGDFVKSCINAKIKESPLSLIFTELNQAFQRYEPEPPTVRPMSELPEEGTVVDCLTIRLIDGTKFWAKADFNQNRFCIFYPDWDNTPLRFQENEVDFSDGEYNAVGWIPRLQLPNPNDIKL